VAGGGEPISDDHPGPALQVALLYPQGIWLDSNGDVYFSDRDNRIVRRLARDGSVTNFATTVKRGNSAGVFLYYAAGLVADDKYFYMSDPNGHRVWRVSSKGGDAESYAGTGSAPLLSSAQQEAEGQPARAVDLVSPSGLALDTGGNLFIADGGYMGFERGRILRVDATAGTVTTVLSQLQQPSGLAFQSPGVLCFSEAGAHQVRCVDLSTKAVRTVAGTGAAGLGGDGGPAECAQLNRPSGISFDASGHLYIADTGNQRVRRVRMGTNAARCGEQ
jgi:sugar lactone lactonase YvrE